MTRKMLAIGLALLTQVGCGSSRQSEPLTGRLVLTAEQRQGQVLFHKYCHQCHPHGEAGLGPAINSNPAPMAAFGVQVRSGLGAMPAFSDELISDRQLEQLLAFVATQRHQGG